jgi:hypothetical protein
VQGIQFMASDGNPIVGIYMEYTTGQPRPHRYAIYYKEFGNSGAGDNYHPDKSCSHLNWAINARNPAEVTVIFRQSVYGQWSLTLAMGSKTQTLSANGWENQTTPSVSLVNFFNGYGAANGDFYEYPPALQRTDMQIQ